MPQYFLIACILCNEGLLQADHSSCIKLTMPVTVPFMGLVLLKNEN